jgi:hypothetical protein
MLPPQEKVNANNKVYISYPIRLNFYRRQIDRLLISDHIYENHPDVTDEDIYQLILSLDNSPEVEEIDPPEYDDDFFYFVLKVYLDKKAYKLVL